MNPTRDEILRILKVLFFQSADVDRADIQSLDIMRYAEAFLFTDDRQIPDIGKVKSLIADVTGNGTIERLYTRAGSDVADYELDLSSETDIPYQAVCILYVNQKSQPAATWDFSTKTWSGLPDTVSGDVIEAYYVGREYVAPTELTFVNTTNKTIIYSLNGSSPDTLIAGSSILVSPGDSLVMGLTTAPDTGITYDLANQNGTINSVTDGQSLIDTTLREFNIPSNSSQLVIYETIS